MNLYKIYTDGGTRNTGNVKGGHVKPNDLCAYAYKIIDTDNGRSIEGAHAYRGHTNNQMEVLAVIRALKKIIDLSGKKYMQLPDNFEVISDSEYVDNEINKGWIYKQARNGFDMINGQYWSTLHYLLGHFPNIKFHWVKGHANCQGNIYVDHKLNRAMDNLANKTNRHK